MSINTFNLPDLGEGLPEAEIVTWHVQVGDTVKVDQPMVSVETAKAVVEVPSPFNGVVAKLYGAEGDIIKTHGPLIDVNVNGSSSSESVPSTSASITNSEDPIHAAIDQLENIVEEQENKQSQMELTPAHPPSENQTSTNSDSTGIVTFFLPDLGEGLPEAEIVSWHVSEGDVVKVDQTMVSVETAKAVVEVPSPHNGVIAKLYAGEGDVVKTHAALVDFSVEGATSTTPIETNASNNEDNDDDGDSGTVVGKMQSSDKVLVENVRIGSKRRRNRKNKKSENITASTSSPSLSTQGKFKALPSVRLAAKEQGIDLSHVPATGKFGQVTKDDLRAFASSANQVMAPANSSASMLPAAGLLQRPTSDTNFGVAERLRGPRRAMNHSMSVSRDQVSQCTLFDDADIHYWMPGQDITGRILRALVAGCFAAPELNAWFDQNESTVTKHQHVDVAMAVDTPSGLIVPVLRGVESKSQQELRADLNKIKVATRERTVSPADMANPTITLSNFGMMAGRYATPVLVPPMVTIIGTGGIRHDVVAVLGGIEVHKRVPLSLTFDHRCITGGEACRFLAAMIKDLEKPF